MYVTIATFNNDYVQYIRSEKEPTEGSFLKMHGFGVREHMEELGMIMLAFTIEEDGN